MASLQICKRDLAKRCNAKDILSTWRELQQISYKLAIMGQIRTGIGAVSGLVLALLQRHYSDVVMNAMVSQITGVKIFTQPFVQAPIKSKKKPKLRVTGLSEGNSQVTDEFPAQRASNVENLWTSSWDSNVFSIKYCFNAWLIYQFFLSTFICDHINFNY